MESQCSIGVYINEECHKSVYGVFPKDIKLIGDYSQEEKLLFSLRIGSLVTSACKYHEVKYLNKFYHLFGQCCSDPFKSHKKPIKKGLREITIDHYNKNQISSVNLIPGKALCPTCYSKIFVINKNTNNDSSDDEFSDLSETIHKVDSACEILGVSPASKIRKLSEEKRVIALKNKIEKVSTAVKRNLEVSFQKQLPVSEVIGDSPNLLSDYEELIRKLKDKCIISKKEDKIKIISLLPSSWSREKICEEFQVSERLVKLSRYLLKEQGILPTLQKKNASNLINDSIIEKVIHFYEDDNNSRLMPGKKDCISLKENGIKVQRQKRLILCNLNEIFTEFKKENPDIKIGRSKFCELRPKWCIVAGASGTHNVCVCLYHQNVKLMINGASLRVDYKDLLEVLVCKTDSYNCMMGKCEDCPGKQALIDMFEESEEDLIPDSIEYKQWVTQDRTEMVTILKPREEFFEVLIDKLESLKMHHFISKCQGKFLKDKKESLAMNECLVLADFSENYSFVVQDEVQGHHWVNKQATVHPFVLYFKDEDDKLKSHSFCVISDHLDHNTATVYAFQQQLVNYLKENHHSIKKLIYFSDGAASQYKNKKNFINMCYHKEDFGLELEWHFFASCHGKNASDGIGGTTKRAVTKASMQRTYEKQILSPQEMFEFCKEHIKGITYVFVKTEEVQEIYTNVLEKRFNTCTKIKGTRSFHCFIPQSDNLIMCKLTSVSSDSEIHQTGKVVPLTLQNKDVVACIYDGQWWIAEVDDIDKQTQDVHVVFYHPPGPRTSFKKIEKDQVWMPVKQILRKLTPIEFTTVTGRTFNITPKLCEEISQRFNEQQ